MWGNEGLDVAFIKKPEAMWDVLGLIAEKKKHIVIQKANGK